MQGVNQDRQASRLIFGDAEALNLAAIERKLAFPRGSMRRYIEQPYDLPLGRFAALCDLLRVSYAEALAALTVYRRVRP